MNITVQMHEAIQNMIHLSSQVWLYRVMASSYVAYLSLLCKQDAVKTCQAQLAMRLSQQP